MLKQKFSTYLRCLLLILPQLSSIGSVFGQDPLLTPTLYVDLYKDLAVREMKRVKIPASITLAQGLLESGNGTSKLALEANNHFGIKCKKSWTGRSISVDDDAPGECFRAYDKAEHSYKDHSDFLTNNKRYQLLFSYEITDYKKWAYGLKECAYATNPKYPDLLIGIIERYKLHLFDDTTSQEYLSCNIGCMDSSISPQFAQKPNDNLKQIFKKDKSDSLFVFSSVPDIKRLPKSDIVIINEAKGYVVQPFDDIHLIALKTGVLPQEILEYNDIELEDILEPGIIIYLEPKWKEAKTKYYHRVQNGETIFFISQLYRVKELDLLNYNQLIIGQEPAEGEEIYLRQSRSYAPKLTTTSWGTNKKHIKDMSFNKENTKNIENVTLNKSTTQNPNPNAVSKQLDSLLKALDNKMEEGNLNSKSQIDHTNKNPEFEINQNPEKTKFTNNEQGISSLKPDQPSNTSPGKVHTVSYGESLFSISKKYGISVFRIKNLNGLTSDSIEINQKLIVGE